jgi:hypothetical protein
MTIQKHIIQCRRLESRLGWVGTIHFQSLWGLVWGESIRTQDTFQYTLGLAFGHIMHISSLLCLLLSSESRPTKVTALCHKVYGH